MVKDNVFLLLTFCLFVVGIGISGFAAHSGGSLYQIAPVGLGVVIILASAVAGFYEKSESK